MQSKKHSSGEPDRIDLTARKRLSDNQRWDRAAARNWGRRALENHKLALYAERQTKFWSSMVGRLESGAALAVSEEEKKESAEAIQHAHEQVAISWRLAENQDAQVKVNARRAFHAAILSERQE